MTNREKEIKTIRQVASNIRKYGKEIHSEDSRTQYEYMIDDIHLLGSYNEVTMYRTDRPIILLEAGIVTPDWLDSEIILNRGSVYEIIDIIKEHNELKLLEGIE